MTLINQFGSTNNKDDLIKEIDKITELNSLCQESVEETLEIKHQIIINKRDYIVIKRSLEMKKQKQ